MALVLLLTVGTIPFLTSHAAATISVGLGETTTQDGVTYTLDNAGKLTISGSGEIPDNAFNSNKDIKSVVIGNGITSIGKLAFYYGENLTSVSISNSVKSIGESAFNCSGLTTVNIPNSVTSIGESAFGYCKMTSVTIPDSVTSIGISAFSGCSSLTTISIPSSVTSIKFSTFSSCRSLTSVTIPSSVTSIGNYAFRDCTGLTSVTIPSSVTSIGSSAFSGCSSLTTISISSSVTSIGNRAFYGCTNLTISCSCNTPTDNLPAGKYTKPAHQITAIAAKAATCEKDGNTAHWKCSVCGNLFSDANATTEITEPESVIVAALGHSFTYAASGATLTGTCSHSSNCDYTGGKITLTISANNATYDGNNHSATLSDTTAWTAAGLTVPTINYEGRDSTSYTKSATAPKNAGTYTAQCTATIGGNSYTVSKDYTISPKEVGLTWSNTSFTYDGTPHKPTATVTNCASGDSCIVNVTGVQTNAGNYTATAYYLSNSNYTLPLAKTTSFTIAKKNATVTADDKSKTYGEDDPELTATVSGILDGESLNYTLSRASGENAGEYAITVALGSNPNYNVTATNDTFTIAKKSATITADDKSKTYGADDPELTATVTGLVGNDTLNYTLSRVEGDDVGEYAIAVTLGDNPNYDVTVNSGTFTIEKTAPTFTAPTAKSLTYNGSAQELVNAGETEEGTMQYALGTDAETPPEDSEYAETVPTGTNAGTYYVWYKVVGDDNHSDAEPSEPVTVRITNPPAIVVPAVDTATDAETAAYAFVPDGTSDAEVASAASPVYEWEQNSTDSLLFVIKSTSGDDRTFEKFSGGVFVDNNRLNETQYDAAKGSLRLTLRSDYLETLSVGEHTLRVEFADGSVTQKFMVLAVSAGYDSPNTGESNAPAALCLMLLAASGACAASVILRRRTSA